MIEIKDMSTWHVLFFFLAIFTGPLMKGVIFMFENKKINGIHASRFIMSWVREGGRLGHHGEDHDEFKKWLRSLGLNEDEINDIWILASNGKMELEASARKFINNNH